jgi:hypothetical protein
VCRDESASCEVDIALLFEGSDVIVTIDWHWLLGVIETQIFRDQLYSLNPLLDQVHTHCLKIHFASKQQISDIDAGGRIRCGILQSSFTGVLDEGECDSAGRCYVCVGAHPIISIYSLSRQRVSARQVVSTVANNLRSIAASWAPRWYAQPSTVEIQLPASLYSQTRCIDGQRKIITIVSEPVSGLCALSDVFGRVILFDSQHGVITKLWKGYRDAQIQFCFSKKVQRLLLTIHLPRRQIIEVWNVWTGQRVWATTTVSLFASPQSSINAILVKDPFINRKSIPSDANNDNNSPNTANHETPYPSSSCILFDLNLRMFVTLDVDMLPSP